MTGFQKAIKYLAMAFALFLIVSILSGIFSALGLVSNVFDNKDAVGEMQTYTVSGDIQELKLDINAAKLRMSCVPPSAHLNMLSGAYRADMCSTNCLPTNSSLPLATVGGTTGANGAACTIMSGTWKTVVTHRQNGTDAFRVSCRPTM